MTWKRVVIDPNSMAVEMGSRLQDEFFSAFVAAHAPPAAVMYGDLRRVGGARSYYFSPEAARLVPRLLASYMATDCPEPDVHNLAVLVDNKGAPLPS
jgi:hypothetical protein